MAFSGAEVGAIVKREGSDIIVEHSYGHERDGLPKNFIRYVLNTSETTTINEPGIITETLSANDFSSEEYFLKYQPASVFCQTIDRRTPINRALYLENKSIKGAFGARKQRVLNLLSPQAAICIENAELYDSLEERVHQRTAELEEANAELERQRGELARARDAAENAARTKSEFLATMSHEIRTPMNTILGMASLTMEHELSEKTRDYLSKLHLSACHLLGIIDNILDYSLIEAGHLCLANSPFEVESVFEQLTSIAGVTAFEKGLNFWYDFDTDLPEILVGDALRFKQVLINLIS